MKFLTTLSVILLSLSSFAVTEQCEVFGISDSPQALSCKFPKLSVDLSCRKRTYFLNDSEVEVAFHYDVERGPTPLVFKSSDMQLVVIKKSGPGFSAELQIGNTHLRGNCR
jgi:hypothetical protein